MSKDERIVFELIIMAQTKYMRDLALLLLRPQLFDDAYINGLWEEQKKTLAAYFSRWDK